MDNIKFEITDDQPPGSIPRLPLPKIVLVGHSRHGKDTVAEILSTFYGMSFKSSSEFLAERLCFNALKDKYGYKDSKECFDDRHNHRKEWYDLIANYCADDPTRLGKEIFKESDIYCGLRNKREFTWMRNTGIFDLSIWVDRSRHLPPEDKESNDIEPWMADFIIDNNGSRDDLVIGTRALMDRLIGPEHMMEMQGNPDADLIKLDFSL